jgi:glycosyltransferase involved in cell wall biosynthesis
MLSALLIGNHLSASGRNPTVSEELARRFRQDGMHIVTTSDRAGRLARLGDMLRTTWSRRQHYDVAQIDVYSGPAFIWAEAVAAALAALSKPFVLSLHGGNLPRFAATHGRRVRRLLRAAHTATCPSAYLARELRHLRADIRIVPNPLDTAKYRSPAGGDTDRASRRGVACYARLPLAPPSPESSGCAASTRCTIR